MDLEGQPQYPLDPDRLQRVLPEAPGVYLFKDEAQEVLYVGKAKSLRKRVLSYFRPPREIPPKTLRMLEKARGLHFVLTATEQDALILERNLIGSHMPRYNIVLRDDKQYPVLCLDLREAFPRLRVVRRIKKDGALYFGPFSSALSVRQTLKTLDRLFKLRKCKGKDLPKRSRPCLNHQMGRCLGPCATAVSEEEYRNMVAQVRLFLEGRNTELLQGLVKEMEAASEALAFERAAAVRDRIRAVERTIERQHVVSSRMEDQDVVGVCQEGDLTQILLLFVRKGCVLGSRGTLLTGTGNTPAEVIEAFLKQHYPGSAFIPGWILLSETIEDREAIEGWLGTLAGKRIRIRTPLRGEGRDLVKMALENAAGLLKSHQEGRLDARLQTLKDILGLRKMPRRVEGLDISNLQGEQAVGTVAAFLEGDPEPSRHRNLKIREVEGIDDYAMMAELVRRRLAKGAWPDLFVVDGGKGHLNAVQKTLEAAETGGTDGAAQLPECVSLAKPRDERGESVDKIYLPGRKNPVILERGHPVLLFLMKVRDETHRRAISYHRLLRRRRLTRSLLDEIQGIGARRKKSILTYVSALEDLAQVRVEDLAALTSMNRTLAERVLARFQAETSATDPLS